jgi:hypothetical protein
VRHGVRKLITAVTAVDPDAGTQLVDGLEFDYAKPGEKPEGGGVRRPSGSGY